MNRDLIHHEVFGQKLGLIVASSRLAVMGHNGDRPDYVANW
jgi:hypothetical protein